MDKIQKELIRLGHKDLADEYYNKIASLDINRTKYYLEKKFSNIDEILTVNGDLGELRGTAKMNNGTKKKFIIMQRKNGIFVDFLNRIEKV